MKLYERFNYLTEAKYIISSYIREYDISKANINILLYKKVIDKNLYDYLYNSDRMTRQVTIGKMIQKNRSIQDKLKEGLIEFRKRFFLSNNIEDQDIISIKNDAIFLLNKIPKYTKFDNIEFKLKNIFSSYYKLGDLEFYYLYDRIHDRENISIKGINDNKMHLHTEYFIDFLKAIFCEIEIGNLESSINMIKEFYNNYINRKININYYRELNPNSNFRLNVGFKYNTLDYTIPEISNKQSKYIDISYNARLLLELYKIAINIYFRKNNN